MTGKHRRPRTKRRPTGDGLGVAARADRRILLEEIRAWFLEFGRWPTRARLSERLGNALGQLLSSAGGERVVLLGEYVTLTVQGIWELDGATREREFLEKWLVRLRDVTLDEPNAASCVSEFWAEGQTDIERRRGLLVDASLRDTELAGSVVPWAIPSGFRAREVPRAFEEYLSGFSAREAGHLGLTRQELSAALEEVLRIDTSAVSRRRAVWLIAELRHQQVGEPFGIAIGEPGDPNVRLDRRYLKRHIDELRRPAVRSPPPVTPTALSAVPRPPTNVFSRRGNVWEIGYGGEFRTIPKLIGLRYLAELLDHPNKRYHCADLRRIGAALPEGGEPSEETCRKNISARLRDAFDRLEDSGPKGLAIHLRQHVTTGASCWYDGTERFAVTV